MRLIVVLATLLSLALFSRNAWLSTFEPSSVSIPADFVIMDAPLHPGDILVVVGVRCNLTSAPLPFRAQRVFVREEDGARVSVPDAVSSLDSVGCDTIVARSDKLTDRLPPPGHYRLEGTIIARGQWGLADHETSYRSKVFEVIP